MQNFVILSLGIRLGALSRYFYRCQPSEEIMNFSQSLITSDEAKKLDEDYNSRYQLISDSIVTRKDGDNRSSWYGLEQVRNFLDYAEKEAKELGYTMNGVRLYLGAHPDQNGEAGYTTMFFIPTGRSNKGQAAMLNLSIGDDDGDILGGGGMDMGSGGEPPTANYPQ